MHARLGLLVLVVGIGFTWEVQAGCRQVCTPMNSCDQLSGDERWRCIRSPSEMCRTVCSDSYGAIAYSRKNGAWGHSFDHDSQARAGRVAQGHCARRAPDCSIVVSFVNQCGAIAETKQHEVSPGLGKTKKEAEDRSLSACRAAGGKTCTVVAYSCSGK